MADEKIIALAKNVFDTLCAKLDNLNLHYEKQEEQLFIRIDLPGNDLPMNFIIAVETEQQIIKVLSVLPYKFPEDKRMEGAIATCAATYRLADGSFDYDLSNGSVLFRLTASFRESLIGEGLFHYLLACSCTTVDEYNHQFLAIGKGELSITDFIKNDN